MGGTARPGCGLPSVPAVGRIPRLLGQESKLSRRTLIGAAAAGAAGAALAGAPGVLAAERGSRRRSVDVAIVGAGFAGLTAAVELHRHGKSVAVLEARDRVGGRAHNHHIGGGEISEARRHVRRPDPGPHPAAREAIQGRQVPHLRHRRQRLLQGRDPPDLQRQDADRHRSARTRRSRRMRRPSSRSWTSSPRRSRSTRPGRRPAPASGTGRRSSRGRSTHSSYSKNESFRRLVAVATRPIFGAEPRELSFLFTLFYIAASGDEKHPGTFERNFSTRDGAQMWRFHGGTELLAQKMAKQSRQPGGAALAGHADRPGRRPRHRPLRAPRRAGEAGDRRRSAHARRPHPLPAADAARPRPAHPAPAPGDADEGRGRLRQAVLARRRPQRHGAVARTGPSTRPSTTRRPTASRGSSSASSAATRRATSCG